MALLDDMKHAHNRMRDLRDSLVLLIAMSDVLTEAEKMHLFTVWYVQSVVAKHHTDMVVKQYLSLYRPERAEKQMFRQIAAVTLDITRLMGYITRRKKQNRGCSCTGVLAALAILIVIIIVIALVLSYAS